MPKAPEREGREGSDFFITIYMAVFGNNQLIYDYIDTRLILRLFTCKLFTSLTRCKQKYIVCLHLDLDVNNYGRNKDR